MNQDTDRRHFWRAAFQANAHLIAASKTVQTRLLDISLKGALLANPEGWHGGVSEACRLELPLSKDAVIVMEGHIAHREGGHLGFRCERIDLDSITHLRRLVELNSGDAALLERELHALVAN